MTGGYWKTATLPDRLRALAAELESAERFGLQLPISVTLCHGADFLARDHDDFTAWADYLESAVIPGRMFDHAESDVNGLQIRVSCKQPSAVTA